MTLDIYTIFIGGLSIGDFKKSSKLLLNQIAFKEIAFNFILYKNNFRTVRFTTGSYLILFYIISNFYLSPQTSSAISFTSFNFSHCSSSVSLLPISQDANPHCGLKYRRSSGTYFSASWILAMTFPLSSNCGIFVVMSPSTTFLSPDTFASGAKPPDLLSSYSR